MIMGLTVQFVYKSKSYFAEAFLSFEEEPYYIFIALKDADLVREFGDDITIKTDGEILLPRRNSYPDLNLLYQSIFPALKNSKAFLLEVSAQQLRRSRSSYLSF